MATTIIIKNKTFQVATTWNELSPKQLVQVIKIVFGKLPACAAHFQMVKVMAGINTILWNSLTANDIIEFLYLADDLLNKSRLTKQSLPDQGGFVGPADDFVNLTVGEYAFTEDYFFAFKDDQTNLQALNDLVAVLFRPVKTLDKDGRPYDLTINPEGDTREVFNQYRCSHHARTVISGWDFNLKLAILTWYEHNRLQIIDDFPDVFKGAQGEPALFGMMSTIRSVAQGGTFGDFFQVEGLPIRMVMMELVAMITEAEQLNKLNPTT